MTNEMSECPYCVDRDGFPIELERVGIEEKEHTGELRYVCPECGFEVWE